jgi:glycosyltransferase involved in cell wall biosynthesis
VTTARPHIGFVLEHSLGHTTHAQNLCTVLARRTDIDAEIVEVPYEVTGLPARIPGFNGNWTIRSGVRAWRGIRAMHHRRPLDAVFVHTQVPAVLSSGWFRSIPAIVSLDATPLQYDELGASYDHRVGSAPAERLKWRAAQRCFQRAAHIVTWSQWAKDGVVGGYGIAETKVTVIPPGVVLNAWKVPRRDDRRPGSVRILFVGGDFARKGGDVLLDAFARLRPALAVTGVDIGLDLVTREEVPVAPGVVVHRGLQPNSPALIELYRAADIFCLPTQADCLGLVLCEAGATGLPLVATAVGGIPEIVRDGQTGRLVAPGDVAALEAAVRDLVEHPDRRAEFGAAARSLVTDRYDAGANAEELVDLLLAVSRPPAGARPTASR